jgi:phage terminase large subunit-like protein
LSTLTPTQLKALQYDWNHWARPEQIWPLGAWHTWLILAGRGFGKTRLSSEATRFAACGSTPLGKGRYGRIALVGETAADVRDVMVEGPAGVLACHPKDFRPKYYPSRRLLEWPNGATAHTYNATEPDQLRGPQHDYAALDELAKWRYARETWDMLQFGLRLGSDPRQVITTTPRPIQLVRDLIAKAESGKKGVVLTRGTTYDNLENLAATFRETIVADYEGTRLGRQELNAEVLDEVAGALWTRANIDEHRISADKAPEMQRIVVGIDPAAKESAEGDRTSETGIIAVGFGVDGRGYVFDDASCRLSPRGWARRAIAVFDAYEADAIVVEINQGGAMVETVLRSERGDLPLRQVRASRGKAIRAEPIAALYEQGRVSHVGTLAGLEDQMVMFTPFGPEGGGAADRVDALVWALADLFPRIIGKQQKMETEERGSRASWLA